MGASLREDCSGWGTQPGLVPEEWAIHISASWCSPTKMVREEPTGDGTIAKRFTARRGAGHWRLGNPGGSVMACEWVVRTVSY